VVLGHSFIGGKKGIFVKIHVWNLKIQMNQIFKVSIVDPKISIGVMSNKVFFPILQSPITPIFHFI